jgi:hypothetical protein
MFQNRQNETELDHYHITLSMAAAGFLATTRDTLKKGCQ